MHITTLPYYPPSLPGKHFNRIIVKPIPKESKTTEEGLLIPTDVGKICEIGIVISTSPDSAIEEGSTIMYAKLDRTSKEHLDTVQIENEYFDFLYENEVWAVNNQPFNRIFVEPFSSLQVNDGGLILPEGVKGTTQKGKVFRSPAHYTIKPDDHIEYRAPEQDIYPTIEIEGKRYDVLNEWDVFTVNNHVAPYRIIVKIDMAQQRIKRTTNDTGLIRTQLFQFMLFNMQCGLVTEIGEEAQKNYPELKVGDTAILHHRIESDKYRLLRTEDGKHAIAYEYRIINAFDTTGREIFGRISSRKDKVFVAFGKNVFLDWEFEVMEKHSKNSSLYLEFENNLDKCTTLDDFNSTLKHKTDEGFSKGMAKIKGTIKVLSTLKLPEQKDKYDQLESELNLAKQEATKVAASLNKNHLLICKRLGGNEKVLVTYKELYPINILGRKFLIGYEDYIIATLGPEAVSAMESPLR